jgi:chemotaxis protein CheD
MTELKQYFLYPGTLFVADKPYYITTLLGSCVAVCLYDQRLKIGGMNHFLLPNWDGKGLASPKYGNIAINQLIDKMERLGSRKRDLISKTFGGANVLGNNGNIFQIGERNIKIAGDLLDDCGIPVKAASTGGLLGRKIIFNTMTGEVRMKYISKNGNGNGAH